jgi:DNA topoisomerase I
MTNLLIVESPGKIKKIKGFLGSTFQVMASMGHFRQLANDGEDNLGFDFQGERVLCRFTAKDSKSQKTIQELRKAAASATKVYIATDPDREGEVIGWHLQEILKHSNIVRISYSEITEQAILQAIARPRNLDLNLVGSGLARSCLDKLVGFKGSPLVWPLGAKSVGRVQSAVLHLVANREREIINFKPVDYFSVFVDYAEGFRAFYSHGLSIEPPPELETREAEEDASANRPVRKLTKLSVSNF